MNAFELAIAALGGLFFLAAGILLPVMDLLEQFSSRRGNGREPTPEKPVVHEEKIAA